MEKYNHGVIWRNKSISNMCTHTHAHTHTGNIIIIIITKSIIVNLNSFSYLF